MEGAQCVLDLSSAGYLCSTLEELAILMVVYLARQHPGGCALAHTSLCLTDSLHPRPSGLETEILARFCWNFMLRVIQLSYC